MTHEKLLTAAEIADKLDHVQADQILTWDDTDVNGVPATTGVIDIHPDGRVDVLTERRTPQPSGSPDWDAWLADGNDPDYFAFLDAVAAGTAGPPLKRPGADA